MGEWERWVSTGGGQLSKEGLGAEGEAVWRCSEGRRYGKQIFSLARDSGAKTRH